MAYENELQIPATTENTAVEETNLQIEELEPRVAPNFGKIKWGPIVVTVDF